MRGNSTSLRKTARPSAFGIEFPDEIQSVEGGGTAVRHAMVRCAAGRAFRANPATRSAARESDAARYRSMAGIAIVPEGLRRSHRSQHRVSTVHHYRPFNRPSKVPHFGADRAERTESAPARFKHERPHRAEAAAPTSRSMRF